MSFIPIFNGHSYYIYVCMFISTSTFSFLVNFLKMFVYYVYLLVSIFCFQIKDIALCSSPLHYFIIRFCKFEIPTYIMCVKKKNNISVEIKNINTFDFFINIQ